MTFQRLLIALAIAIIACAVISLCIHFVMLSTDRFNWLEPARTQPTSGR